MFTKFKSILVAASLTLLLGACSGGHTPESVAKDFLDKMYRGDGEAVVAMVYIPEEDKKPGVEDMLKGKIVAGAAQVKEKAAKHGGVKEITTQAVQYADDKKDKGVVPAEVSFSDGNKKNEKVKVIKVNGDWKIRL